MSKENCALKLVDEIIPKRCLHIKNIFLIVLFFVDVPLIFCERMKH